VKGHQLGLDPPQAESLSEVGELLVMLHSDWRG